MSSVKQLRFEEKLAVLQQEMVRDLEVIAKDIERSEKTILPLNRELQAANAKYQGPRNTREDVAYLTSLLECAKRKLAWEKQIASLQKRAPLLMERMAALMNDPKAPPSTQVREQMMRSLQAIQAAMERLQAAHNPEVSGGGPERQ